MRCLLTLAGLLLLAGCSADPDGTDAPATSAAPLSASGGAPATSSPSSTEPVPAVATLACDHSIGGDPPPLGYQVILDVVTLPSSPGGPALQAGPSGEGPDTPALFAKTGLLVKAGAQFELETPPQPGNRTAIGWGSWSGSAPTQRFVIPGCTEDRGTGWLAYAGGYYADRPLCLPLIVRAGGQERHVSIGVGAACPGQQPPPSP